MFWKNLTHIPRKHPLAFGLAISTVKTSVCDLLVQTTFEKKDEIDWRRNIFFGAFGFAYKRNIVEDNLACWKVWVPAMFINFSVMPMWARIPWVTTVSFMWTCIISSMRGGEIANEKLERNDSIYVWDHSRTSWYNQCAGRMFRNIWIISEAFSSPNSYS